MNPGPNLIVWYEDAVTGKLIPQPDGSFFFQYEPDWLRRKNAFPVSHSLPLQKEPFPASVSRSFFANLLPEGNIRSLLAKSLKISESSDYQFLEKIGGECAGALQIFPEGLTQETEGALNTNKKLLDDNILNKIIKQKSIISLYHSEDHLLRLSLAGARHKLPVLYDPETKKLFSTNSPSSHILKIPSRDFKYLPENEYFLNLVARESDLEVPPEILFPAPGSKTIHLLLNERFDRIRNNSHIKRIHQEDFCQALGISHANKYEKEGGPSLRSSIQLIRDISVEPALDTERFLDWIIFNFICGNADAHGKNLSILYTKSGLRLSPFYDLVATAAYKTIDKHMAMNIGGQNDPGKIGRREWESCARELEVGRSFLIKKVINNTSIIKEAADRAWEYYKENHGELEFLNQIRIAIHRKAKRTRDM
jgi:serine/threonine-protein kinase HipA